MRQVETTCPRGNNLEILGLGFLMTSEIINCVNSSFVKITKPPRTERKLNYLIDLAVTVYHHQ